MPLSLFLLEGKEVSASIILTETLNGKGTKDILRTNTTGTSFMTTCEFFLGCPLRTRAMSARSMLVTDTCAAMRRVDLNTLAMIPQPDVS